MNQPNRTVFLCHICGETIAAFNPDEIPLPEVPVGLGGDEYIAWAAQAKLEALTAANEQVILRHVQIWHKTSEILEALGTARNALMDVREMAERAQSAETLVYASDLIEATQRGLGGK